MTDDLVVSELPWFKSAAIVQVDMERGLYDWGRKAPRNPDGTYRVVRKQILREVGVSPEAHDARKRIWENPSYEKLVRQERSRRDIGIRDMMAEVEKAVGPLHETRLIIEKHLKDIFERGPDSEDPDCLSPKDYVHESLALIRYIDETEGRFESVKVQGLETVLAAVGANVSQNMTDQALQLVKEYRALQDAKLANVIDGEVD